MIRIITILLHALLLFFDLAAGNKVQKLHELYGKFSRIHHEQGQRWARQTRRSDGSLFLNEKSASQSTPSPRRGFPIFMLASS